MERCEEVKCMKDEVKKKRKKQKKEEDHVSNKNTSTAFSTLFVL